MSRGDCEVLAMGLFDKKRSVIALGDQALETIHNELNSVLSVAKSYDDIMSKSGDMMISLEGRIRGDLLAFMLYLSGVGKIAVSPSEIATVNKLFDINLSHEDFRLYRKDVGEKAFERSVPPAILLLKELGTTLQREAAKTEEGRRALEENAKNGIPSLAQAFGDDLINVYALIGSALISADSKVTERESGDLVRYLWMINQVVNGADAPLPAGAAQRTLEAHVRLFGKQPKR